MVPLQLIIFIFCNLLNSGNFEKIKIPVGGIFEGIDLEDEIAFKTAIDVVNKRNLLPKYELIPISIPIQPQNITAKKGGDVIDIEWDVPYEALKATCNLLERGVAAIFMSLYDHNANTVQSICDSKEVPVIRTVGDRILERECCSINLFPHIPNLARAFADLVAHWGWKSFTIMYESQDMFENISEILQLYNSSGHSFIMQYLYQTDKGNYRNALKEVRKSGQTNFVLHCDTDNLPDVMQQAQELGLIMKKYSFIVITLDLHITDLDLYLNSGVNLTGLLLIDPVNPKVIEAAAAIRNKVDELSIDLGIDLKPELFSWYLWATTYLMIDAVTLFVETIKQTGNLQPKVLHCKSPESWEHGSTIFNYMKTTVAEGLSGIIEFDHRGFRSNFTLDLVELTEEGLLKIGKWNTNNGLSISRPLPKIEEDDETSLRNVHLTVLICWADPYAFFKNSTSVLLGNNQFDGFVIDLIQELSALEGFTYTFIRNEEDKNGDFNKTTGKWNGMIGDLLENRGDIAIGDMTITRDRLKVVDFTTPFMSLGIQILYKKPTKGTPDFFSFALPFAPEVWLLTAISYFGVSLGLYLMARVCRLEWDNWDRCTENPEYLINQFNVGNSLWFITGCLMQQGADIGPRGASTRLLSSVWAFFILIIVSYYKASLAAFLTTEVKIVPFNNVEELVSRAHKLGITYGAVANEPTHRFFQNADIDVYKKVGKYMDNHPEYMVEDNYVGITKVLTENYAFFSESVTIKYAVNDLCSLMSVGDLLDERYFAIALKKDTLYRKRLSDAILKLQENGVISDLERKWWEEKFDHDPCFEPPADTIAPPLNNHHVAGIFWITFGGIFLACGFVFIELGLHIFKTGTRNFAEFVKEYKKEMLFNFTFKKTVKPVKNGKIHLASSEDVIELKD